MSGHARLSASQTKRWMNCPGSVAVLEARPDLVRESGSHARMGTCAHTLGERCLKNDEEPSQYLGRFIRIIEDQDGSQGTSILRKGAKTPTDLRDMSFEVDRDMVEAVTHFTDYVRMRVEELGLTMKSVRLESHVTPLPDRDDTGGTADVIIDAWPELLEVIDYKNGSGVFVPVEGNEQLRSYTLGALGETGAAMYDYDRIRYTICQPRHMQAPHDGIMYEETTVEELIDWGKKLSRHAGYVDEARECVANGGTMDELFNMELLSVGEDGAHCTFCDLSADCPARLAKAQELAKADFIEDDPDKLGPMPDPDRLAMLLPWVPFLDKWVKSLEANGERLLLSGGEIEGYKLVHGRSTRSLKDGASEKRIVTYLGKHGAEEEDMYNDPKPATLRTGPQLEKLIPASERADFEKKFMHKSGGKLTMAHESDKREAVTVDPGDDFDDLEDEA